MKIIASILGKMFSGGKLVGRIGGDEFVIFIPENLDKADISDCVLRIKRRFQKLQLPSSLCLKISMTVAGNVVQEEDDFVELFDR